MKLPKTSSIALALLLAMGSSTVAARADAQPRRDPAAAQILFEQALTAFEAGRVEEACSKFEESMRLDPANGTLMNLARCHEAQGKTASAWSEYEAAATLSERAGQKERAMVAAAAAARLEPRLSRLKIVVADDAEEVVVMRNGVVLNRASLGTALPIDPGTHRIVVSAPGKRPFETTIEVTAAASTQEVVVPALADAPVAHAVPRQPRAPDTAPLEPPTFDDDDGVRGLFIGGMVVGGVGVGGLVAGAVLGSLAYAKVSEAEEDPALCPARRCTRAGRAVVDSAESMGNGATALLVGGGVLAAAGVIMVSVDLAGRDGAGDSGPPQTATLSPMGAPGGGGVTLRVDF